jgi:hypothetical protein
MRDRIIVQKRQTPGGWTSPAAATKSGRATCGTRRFSGCS